MESTEHTRRGNKTRISIIENACLMIKKEGLENFTILQLISKLGIGVGTFYHYFGSKEELIFQTLIYMDEQFVTSFDKRHGEVKSDAEKLRLFLREQAVSVSNLTSQYLDNYRHVLKNEILTYYFNAKKSPKYQRLVQIIEDGQNDGEFTLAFSANSLAETVWTIMAGAADFSRMSEMYDLVSRIDALGVIVTDLLKCV